MAIEPPPRASGKPAPLQSSDRDFSNLRGLLKWQGPPVTLEEMQAAIETGAVARYRRATGANIPVEDEA